MTRESFLENWTHKVGVILTAEATAKTMDGSAERKSGLDGLAALRQDPRDKGSLSGVCDRDHQRE